MGVSSLDKWHEDLGYYDAMLTGMAKHIKCLDDSLEDKSSTWSLSRGKDAPLLCYHISFLSVKMMAFSAGSVEKGITSFFPSCSA